MKNDLLQLCLSNAILPQFQSFYESLFLGTVMGNFPDNIDPDRNFGNSDSDAESEKHWLKIIVLAACYVFITRHLSQKRLMSKTISFYFKKP